MFRRQPFDKVNPRNVVPSRHTVFIRGLPGPTDVTKVKEYFSTETGSKCSVDFFSTSDDKKRLSVAIRFKSHDVAREMLTKYNNKLLMGFPVELTWFKDLKKARAKMFEEQRQIGGRPFQRNNFRGNFRSGDRRAIQTSPNNYFDNGRRMRAGSSSSGGVVGGSMNRPRYSNSRSRSFTGSSSRSISRSGRSESGSPRGRRMMQHNPDDMRVNMRGFSDGQPGSFNDRQVPRNQSYRSASGSTSTSRSSTGLQMRRGSATGSGMASQKLQPMRYQHGRSGASPLNYGQNSRRSQISGSPEARAPDYTFSNAPAPELDGGSSLVSGLIQLKRRNQPEPQDPRVSRRTRQASIGSSSSGLSGGGSRGGLDNLNRRAIGKRAPSLSPPFTGSAQRVYKSPKNRRTPDQPVLCNEENTDFPKQKRPKRMTRSPDSLSPPVIRSSYLDASKPGLDARDSSTRRQTSPLNQSTTRHNRRDDTVKASRVVDTTPASPKVLGDDADRRARGHSPNDNSRWRMVEDGGYNQEGWPVSSRRAADRNRKTTKVVDESFDGESSYSDIEDGRAPSRKYQKHVEPVNKEADSKSGKENVLKDIIKDTSDECQESAVDLIRTRKETLAQDYKRDCEAFTTVVRTLISKDAELESRLMPMLKEILHERGQRCIEELRTFIADHHPESDTKTEGCPEVPVS
ncbi:Dentin sialophosphoprotein [Paragonimus heterotremus]|uniref:Dentin sialophosphoprotein n=1 Tax=Paragonimus heterotremus TaxID=100268 RepID=A0A8J4SH73_9TREM|nr:Dentin sialophosphoprotein [Paragonimus heterotremus]